MHGKRVTIVALVLVAALATVATTFPAVAQASFADYTDLASHWAKKTIEELYDLGALDAPPRCTSPTLPSPGGRWRGI